MQPLLAEKKLSGSDHPLLFVPVNRLQGSAKPIIHAGFHLHKNDDLPVQNDQIQFPDRTAIVTFYKPIALLLKISLRDQFSLSP